MRENTDLKKLRIWTLSTQWIAFNNNIILEFILNELQYDIIMLLCLNVDKNCFCGLIWIKKSICIFWDIFISLLFCNTYFGGHQFYSLSFGALSNIKPTNKFTDKFFCDGTGITLHLPGKDLTRQYYA